MIIKTTIEIYNECRLHPDDREWVCLDDLNNLALERVKSCKENHHNCVCRFEWYVLLEKLGVNINDLCDSSENHSHVGAGESCSVQTQDVSCLEERKSNNLSPVQNPCKICGSYKHNFEDDWIQTEVIHCPNKDCKGMLLTNEFKHELKCSDCNKYFIFNGEFVPVQNSIVGNLDTRNLYENKWESKDIKEIRNKLSRINRKPVQNPESFNTGLTGQAKDIKSFQKKCTCYSLIANKFRKSHGLSICDCCEGTL